MRTSKPVTEFLNLLWMLLVFLAVAFFFLGCSQNKRYQPQSDRQPVSYGEKRPVSSGRYRAVALADLDNDGNLDVVAGGSSPATLAISYGDGLGGMSPPVFLSSKGDVQSLAIADFNEDGLMDLAVSAQRATAGIKIWQNRSRQKWIKTAGPIEINNYQGLASGDINGDGHFDIVAANASSDTQGGIQVWLGDGNGNWLTETGPTITGRYMDVALADFNEDGILDLAAAGWGIYGALRIWLGDSTGNWSSTPPLSKGSHYGVSVGDLNRDGHLDILSATYRAGVHIFLGDGTGAFVKTVSPQDEGSFWDIIPVDLDGDGVLDLMASSLDSNGIKAWRNEGPGSWAEIQERFPSSGIYYGLALADLNRDGQDDVCAASLGEGIKLWKVRGGPGDGHSFPKRKPLHSPREKDTIEAIEGNTVYTTISGFPEYKIGPGDVLEITLWYGTSAKKEEILIRPDGKISFGFIEDLYVSGLTATQLDDLLTRYVKEYIKQPRMDVVVKQYNSKSVTITGAIQGGVRTGPGTAGAGEYGLSGKMSLLELVSKAGGPTADANLRNVRVRRRSGQTISLDLNKAIFQGDPGQDIILDAGDLVFIPTLSAEANRVYVFGEVKEPGLYAFTRSDIRLFDAISKAGGPTVFATEESTKIVRGDVTHPEILSVDLKKLIEQGDQTQNVLLASGDLVYVPRRFWGDVNIFWKRVKPLFELIFSPANIVNEYDDALDALSGD